MNARAVGCMVMLLACCVARLMAQPAAGQAAHDADGLHDRELVVAVNRDYPPYEYQNEQGELVGFDVDIVRAVAEASGLKVRFVTGVWSELRAALERGEIDMIAGMLYSDHRAEKVLFSKPFLQVHYGAFVRRGKSLITSFDELEGRRIVVERASLMHDRLRNMGFAGQIIVVASEPEALRRVAAGDGDIAIIPLLIGRMLIAQESLAGMRSDIPALIDTQLCIACPPNRTHLQAHLNEGLAAIRHDGRYDAIYDKWFGVLDPRPRPIPAYMRAALWVSGVVALLLVAMMCWSWSLRRQVRSRTEALEQELARRREIERRLRGSEARFRLVIEHAGDGFYVIEPGGRMLEVNAQACRATGYSRDELLGMTVSDLNPHWGPDGIAQLHRELAAAPGMVRTIETEHQRKDGSRFPVEVRVALFETGDRQLVIATTRDITERRAADRALRAERDLLNGILETTVMAVVVIDAHGKITYANRHAEPLLGITRLPDSGGYVLPELDLADLDGNALSPNDHPFQRIREMTGPVYDLRLALNRSGHDRRALSVNGAPLRDEGGAVTGAVLSFVDITEHEQAEQRTRTLLRELDHRVKNNLATVLAIASATAANTSDIAAFQTAFTGRLRAMARTHEALARTRWRAVELNHLVRTILEPFTTTQSDRVQISGDPVELPPRTAQPVALALHELATNAAKYGALSVVEGGVRVQWSIDDANVRLRWVEHDGPTVQEPTRNGFGTDLIRDMVAYELRGEVRLDFTADGVVCEMTLPMTD